MEHNGDFDKVTNKQLLQEVWQGLFGVVGTDDKGLVGDFKLMRESFEDQCNKVDKNARLIYFMFGIIVILSSILGLNIGGVLPF